MTNDTSGLPLRTPAVRALPESLAFMRALLPLRQRAPGRGPVDLDLKATIDWVTHTRLWQPILRRQHGPRFGLSLVFDDGSSMAIWRGLARELAAVLHRHRGLSAVRTFSMDSASTERDLALVRGLPGIGTRILVTNEKALFDATADNILVVLSDCAGDGWFDGRVSRALARWARYGHVAIWHVLAPRMWQRTALGQHDFVQVDVGSRHRLDGTSHATIPVMALRPADVGDWAWALSGNRHQRVIGIQVSAEPALAVSAAASAAASTELAAEPTVEVSSAEDAAACCERFYNTASPSAWHLATRLSVVPLTVPIMRLVMEVTAPAGDQTGYFDLAEILLSGLLQQVRDGASDDAVAYDFHPGVRAELQRAISVSETMQVLNATGRYLSQHLGKPLDFLAWLHSPNLDDGIDVAWADPAMHGFARITAATLRRLGGRYAALAQQFEARMGDEVQESAQRVTGATTESNQDSATVAAWVPMVELPGGRFMMGSADDDRMAYGDEKPAHLVHVSGFACMRYPVTRKLWREVMGKDHDWHPVGPADERPVNNVTWYDAVGFCNALSNRAGLAPCYRIEGQEDSPEVTWVSSEGYRLPTEAEWEYACRAGSGGRWCFGDDEVLLAEYAWYDRNAAGELHPVGEKKPNAWGIHDTHGNVYEWCWDWYGEYQTAIESQLVNPMGLDSGSHRLMRGGSFASWAGVARCANRLRGYPEFSDWDNGLRCVRTNRDTGTDAIWAEPTTHSIARSRATTSPRLGDHDTAPAQRSDARVGDKGREDALQVTGVTTASLKDSATITDLVPMVELPGGSFMMGSADDDEMAYGDEKPAHMVRISSFACMRYAVTRRLWRDVIGADHNWYPEGPADDRPVNNISWFDAVRFCNALSNRTGLAPCYRIEAQGHSPEVKWVSNEGYRLPTEAEWEYACRAGNERRWCFGNDEALLADYAWYDKNAVGETHPVGEKEPNGWGIYDMHGNVWEWCWDWYAEYQATTDSLLINPTGPELGLSRLLRGGSFLGVARFMRCADRNGGDPVYGFRDDGFRCVRTNRDTSTDTTEAELAMHTVSRSRPTTSRRLGDRHAAPVAQRVEARFDDKSQEAAQQTTSATTASHEAGITAAASVPMVELAGGSFTMGSADDDELAFDDEKPAHLVQVSSFACMRYPVTRKLWREVTGAEHNWHPEGPADDCPVNNVTWFDAVQFCNALSKRFGLEPCYRIDNNQRQRHVTWVATNGYRLPTEAEWEYACRAGSQTLWNFGDYEHPLAEHACYRRNSQGQPQLVGSKPMNPWGLCDMHGNVFEWCWDWYGPYQPARANESRPQQSARGPVAGSYRVLRGGSFASGARNCRCADRNWFKPEDRTWEFGFRCVRSLGARD